MLPLFECETVRVVPVTPQGTAFAAGLVRAADDAPALGGGEGGGEERGGEGERGGAVDGPEGRGKGGVEGGGKEGGEEWAGRRRGRETLRAHVGVPVPLAAARAVDAVLLELDVEVALLLPPAEGWAGESCEIRRSFRSLRAQASAAISSVREGEWGSTSAAIS